MPTIHIVEPGDWGRVVIVPQRELEAEADAGWDHAPEDQRSDLRDFVHACPLRRAVEVDLGACLWRHDDEIDELSAVMAR